MFLYILYAAEGQPETINQQRLIKVLDLISLAKWKLLPKHPLKNQNGGAFLQCFVRLMKTLIRPSLIS